jgi:toxin YxiD
MKTVFPVRRTSADAVFALAIFALAILALISCSPSSSTSGASSASSAAAGSSASGSSTTRAGNDLSSGPVRDLRRDEAEGGHILRKHVGQTEAQLRERLERERNIHGASTYTDRSTAEHVVGAAIAQSQEQIQSWLSQPGRHPNLVLDYDTYLPIGRSMSRGEVHSHVCEHAIVVLKYTGPDRYYVLTSYPECRS